jgi:protoporphyrinogen oxidase
MSTSTVVVGGGLAGLSCAMAAGPSARVYEREERVGGLCRTESRAGFTIDHTGHYLHFKDEAMRALVFSLLGKNLHPTERNAWVRIGSTEVPYPFQANLHGLPPRLVDACIGGMFRALEANRPARAGESAAEGFNRTIGEGFVRHFLRPFNEKQFRTPLERLIPAQWGRFLPRPNVEEIVRGALGARVARIGYNVRPWHPVHGGIEELPRALARALPSAPTTGSALTRLRWRDRVAEFSGAGPVPYDILVNTSPLPVLLDLLDPLPPAMRRARAALRWIGVLCLHLCVRRPRETRKHWVYIPDRRYGFYRYGFPANINRADAPRGHGVISAEVSYTPGRRPSLAAALARCKRDLRALGQIGSDREIVDELVVDFPHAYVVFDRAYPEARQAALRFLAKRRILSIGRYGGWVYGGMEDALVEGRDTGRLIAGYGARSASKFAAGVRA